MPKKYIVKLSTEERQECQRVIDRLDGKSQKVRRAFMLLKVDSNGPNWTDEQVSQAYGCRTQTVVNLRRRTVEEGFSVALNGLRRVAPPRDFLLDGEQEARLIAMRLGSPPAGYANWSLRLLAERFVTLGEVSSISHETCRSILKKTV